ncbi:MAG TPA: TIR domain-containing protein [Chitinophagaceae bacterium]|jgi:hypothetical protein|nr:TIR domain-containing protein [Chitinophagaceae bacterium]
MPSKDKVNVFISYSWDSVEHQEWVLSLAENINAYGGNTIIDKYLKYGRHLRLFMERNIKAADVVLVILTPSYKQKAQELKGGVGYEYNIITKELFKVIDSNEKYIPVLRAGNHDTSVPDFLQDFKYVNLCDEQGYEKDLRDLLRQIIKAPLKQPELKTTNTPVMDNDYKSLPPLIKGMKANALKYFEMLFSSDAGVSTKLKASLKIQEWKGDIEEYHQQLVSKFNPKKMILLNSHLEDFKNKVFAKELWTVRAALGTRDPDLARYKKDFREADAEEIYNTVNGILDASHQYAKETASKFNYRNINSTKELKLKYLDKVEMFMNRIIGFGIRSELLHRYYPAHFPVMTQKSLWAMYFLCDSSNEFITIEQKNRQGVMRVSHNWQYPYDRFTFLMNELASELEEWLSQYKIVLDQSFRFGYVNMFLSSIYDLRKPDIALLHEWVKNK